MSDEAKTSPPKFEFLRSSEKISADAKAVALLTVSRLG
jgi:hypothetical protein